MNQEVAVRLADLTPEVRAAAMRSVRWEAWDFIAGLLSLGSLAAIFTCLCIYSAMKAGETDDDGWKLLAPASGIFAVVFALGLLLVAATPSNWAPIFDPEAVAVGHLLRGRP